MVPGGLDVMSSTTRLTSRSSLIMRDGQHGYRLAGKDRQGGGEGAGGSERAGGGAYSHSMVPGGLLVTSRTTRLISRTSLVMRVLIRAITS